MTNLQDRQVQTKDHTGIPFDNDNTELCRILMSILNGITLDNVIRDSQCTMNGLESWNAILANVQGSSYKTELKRQGDAMISGAFFDLSKNFIFKKYFDKHMKSYKLYLDTDAHVPEWRKIKLFMKGVRCTELQNDYHTLCNNPRYSTFTSMHNKLNENYRTLIDQEILKPVGVYKRKVSQMNLDSNKRDRGLHKLGGRGNRGRGGRRFW